MFIMSLSRRRFLATSASAPFAGILSSIAQEHPPADRASFFFVSDTHYCTDEVETGAMKVASLDACGRLVDWLNRLPGTELPAEAGGGTLATPHGVVHGGDLVDSGDKGPRNYGRAEVEFAAFAADYGLNGGDGRLRWQVREIHGNHDSPNGEGPVIAEIRARNKRRAGLRAVSENGLHYSWDWGGVHFVALGITAGDDPSVTRKRRYAPLGSLPFLRQDLEATPVEQPVVLMHHVDPARYARTVPDAAALKAEWDYGDVQAYHALIKPRRIAAVLYGHTHVRNIFRWDGTAGKPGADADILCVNTDNASHWNSATQAICHFEIGPAGIRIREFGTKDRWRTAAWTPRVWDFPLPQGK